MAASRKMSDEELHALAEFRCELRRFLRASEELCKAEGVTSLQYQMLLQTRAQLGRTWALVGELAERLHSAPHGVVALVSRAEAAGLVVRKPDEADRRQVQVHLTALGNRLLQRLAVRHRDELSALFEMLRHVDALRG